MSYDSISPGIVLPTICIQERDYYRFFGKSIGDGYLRDFKNIIQTS